MGHKDGTASAWDEYGRRPWDRDYKDEKQREREWETYERAKREWARKRLGKPRARTDERMRDVSDLLLDDFLREEGLLV